eukprot:TRINITY_DN25262_c0_g1_i1.p2 TRINITY_DN25262_c0_g1~~TRINITY_DN25262_c0_g1_i1.p2  ORF type:complete len:195 (-),score=52.79 TRINITY_DN25262_c0_g1_i1:169-753(-)
MAPCEEAVCANCLKPHAAQRCGRCKRAVYCDRKCQAADWRAGHKFHCRVPEVETAEHEGDVREALASADAEEAIIKDDESIIRTDADNVGQQIRTAKLRRHDAKIEELPAEAEEADDVQALRPSEPARLAPVEPARKAEESDDEELRNDEDAAKAFEAADSVEAVQSFSLDPDFDYDKCELSTPEWPYNLRPRP